MERSLILMRHAKSAWPIGVRDHDRPLSSRGRRNAPAAAKWIKQQIGVPDRVVVSPAARTRQTWAMVSEVLGAEPADFEFQPQIYAASWWDLLDVVRATQEPTRSVMLLGHNPSIEDLALQLATRGESRAMRQLRTKFPTSAVVLMTSDSPWSEWGADCAVVKGMFVPRG